MQSGSMMIKRLLRKWTNKYEIISVRITYFIILNSQKKIRKKKRREEKQKRREHFKKKMRRCLKTVRLLHSPFHF